MKKLIQLLLVSCVLMWSTGVFAGVPGNSPVESPESRVACSAGNGDTIQFADISVSLNMDLCSPWVGKCAPCISSLEIQGCKFIDVISTIHVVGEPGSYSAGSNSIYLLSCDGR
ncbi:MAG: hypothetical protein OEU57_12020 [Desulfuromonadales bacterium]|nr:hypothetical protein [Desulfuromonadales bacterium]